MNYIYCCKASQTTRGERYNETTTVKTRTEYLDYHLESTTTFPTTTKCPKAGTSRRYSAGATYIYCPVCLEHAPDYRRFRTKKQAKAHDVTTQLLGEED